MRWTGTAYDALARPFQTTVVQALASGTQSYVTRTKYDSYYGRPVGQELPNGEAVQVLYSAYGHGIAEKEPVSGVEYRRTNTENARGQVTQETFGNGVTLTPTYQFQTGQLTGLTYSGSGGTLRQLGYGYDVFGNLKRQSLGGGASREDYSYDQLHRLVQSIRSGAASGTVNYGFDAVGNLTKKSDFSSNTSNAYSYTGATCGGGANAVKSVALAAGGTRTYCYDANGNLTGDNAGLSLKYDHQNLPTVAQRGALRDDFRYGADGMRTRSWGSDGARVYLPGYEHRTDTGETKVYIGDYAVISKTGATRKVEYLLKDRLGSVDAVANSSGTVTETRGYDAFGKPRNGTWNDLSPAKIASTAVTPKGFTQHEHLNELELIHMNGRMYDYNVGRFMGVDPFIQFPLNSQSLNPYSYILNNPLSGTDPSGYKTCILGVGSNAGCSTQEMMTGTVSAWNERAPSEAWQMLGKATGGASNTLYAKNSAGQATDRAKNGATTRQGEKPKVLTALHEALSSLEDRENISGLGDDWTENDGQLSGDDGGGEDGGERKKISREEMMRSGFGSPNIEDYDRNDPLFHEYMFEVPLCRVASKGCTGASTLMFGDYWSAPTTTPPVRQGRNELWGIPTNPIFHVSGVDGAGNAYFINMTVKGHDYHAGVVASNTYVRGGVLYLRTHGFGYSSNAYYKYENHAVGAIYFSAWQNSVREKMQIHTKESFRHDGPRP